MNHGSAWLAGFSLGLYAAAPLAHHSASISYDMQSEIVHENVPVVEWRFANPHAQLVFEAPNADGVLTRWSASTRNVQSLRRLGFGPQSFKPGQRVTLTGAPGRNNQPIVELHEVALSDGTVIDFSNAAPDALIDRSGAATAAAPTDSRVLGVWQFVRGPVPDEARALAPYDAYFMTVFGQGTELAQGESGDVPLSRAGRDFQANWEQSDDACVPPSGWMGFAAPYLVEIEAPRNGRVRITYEYMDLERTIWLDGRSHPPAERLPPTYAGHSVGYWEGETLVVETTNMLSNLMSRNGIHHSEAAVLREWISSDGDTLTVVRVVEDPTHFTRPVASVIRKERAPVGEITPFGDCIP